VKCPDCMEELKPIAVGRIQTMSCRSGACRARHSPKIWNVVGVGVLLRSRSLERLWHEEQDRIERLEA